MSLIDQDLLSCSWSLEHLKSCMKLFALLGKTIPEFLVI